MGALLGLGLLLLGPGFWSGRFTETQPPSFLAGWLVQDVEAGPGVSGPRVLTRRPSRQPSWTRLHGVGFDTWAAPGQAPSLGSRASWCAARGRGGFSPDGFAEHRWSRLRWDVPDTALARRVRHPVAPVSPRSGLADQPPLITRPLRGPPAPG
ncbi:hypothetical protein HPC49_30550 [Pyxidicoccus fallax]|uniref:Uncharacterized protein n=1 Tax=Pyxidicoccus fallax TaxID=394095 RepID=A0A848L975_9BACT|nr:hypothetical protein [Pyxidicoccus fallax]NMO15560.1 hypothetical protein [Pyxidicoccus fallax]NPC82550.1 hypothetical protein [Pyxidicoccus fallax]